MLYHRQLGHKEDVLGKVVRQLGVMTGLEKMSGKTPSKIVSWKGRPERKVPFLDHNICDSACS